MERVTLKLLVLSVFIFLDQTARSVILALIGPNGPNVLLLAKQIMEKTQLHMFHSKRLKLTVNIGANAMTLGTCHQSLERPVLGEAGAHSHTAAVVTRFLQEASLSCPGVKEESCGTISWTFEGLRGSDTETFVDKGTVTTDKHKSVRMRVHNCSVEFLMVKDTDVGFYFCSDSDSYRHRISLSVVKERSFPNGTSICSLLSPEPQRFSLHSEVELRMQVISRIVPNRLYCTVTDLVTNKKTKLRIRLPDSILSHLQLKLKPLGNNTTKSPNVSTFTNAATPMKPEKQLERRGFLNVKALRGLIAGFAVALLALVCVIVALCRRWKRNQTEREIKNAEELQYATVSFQNNPDPVHEVKKDDTAVVYSSVTFADATALYAKVNKKTRNTVTNTSEAKINPRINFSFAFPLH
ncbi:hypothetical protein WMY93_015276 [Mugilogobius chulae]|uniref:Ig-like domain-containing protein n=1 Tax=Mugilogobius chulae TaxID=88201 RepID=A0AAW0NPK1_9GOBI